MALKDRQDGCHGLEATVKISCGGNWHEDHVSIPHKRIAQGGADWPDSESPVRLAKGISACKLPRTLSSLSRSPTIMSSIDSLSCMEEAITIKDNKVNCSDLDSPVKARVLSSCKLTRNPSSLLRSLTITGIDSLSSMDEAIAIKDNTVHMDRIWQQEFAKKQALHASRRMKPCVLLPFVVIVAFPCVYYYVARNARLGLPLDADGDSSVWFSYVALLFFFSAIVISIKIAFPQVNIMYGLRGVINRSWASLSVTCLKPVSAFLAEDREKKKLGRSSSVIWTIGSKPKAERLKSIKEGVQVYSNGDVFEGEFHQGRCSGSGVYYFYMSGRYEGEWVDGKYDGYGVETWARGSRYRGQYKQGLREGYGIYRFYTGDVYSGEWSKGQSHGCGVQTCEDGSRYVGEFKWGVKHGFGHYRFRNRDTYTGEYFADVMHGYGVYQFVNGHCYEGAWHEGKRHGLGMYTFRNGETQAGYWHAGTLQTSSSLNPPPGASVAVSHTKVLHVVQEARRAAAKAFEVPHVDERVNKAVASANQAANAARVSAAKACAKENA